jgi:hypothetical protein
MVIGKLKLDETIDLPVWERRWMARLYGVLEVCEHSSQVQRTESRGRCELMLYLSRSAGAANASSQEGPKQYCSICGEGEEW